MIWKNQGGDFENPPVGTHVARCYKIVDLGTQQSEYQGKLIVRRQVILGWELPQELMSKGEYEGKPFVTSAFYTMSLHEKSSLRKHLASWRGRDFTEEELKGFDPHNILGKGCMLSLIENEKGRIKVASVSALPKGTILPSQVNPNVFFSLDSEEFDSEIFESFSEKMQEMIKSSPEYKAIISGAASVDPGTPANDDIPF